MVHKCVDATLQTSEIIGDQVMLTKPDLVL